MKIMLALVITLVSSVAVYAQSDWQIVRVNRLINTPTATSVFNPVSHTLLALVHQNTIVATNSWGTSENLRGWALNHALDVAAASAAFASGDYRTLVGGGSEIQDAFNSASLAILGLWEHPNLWIYLNCKTEADYLSSKIRSALGMSHDEYEPEYLAAGDTAYLNPLTIDFLQSHGMLYPVTREQRILEFKAALTAHLDSQVISEN